MSATLLTLGEASERVRLSPWALRRAIGSGELLAYKPRGRIRIPAHALDEWLASTQIRPQVTETVPTPGPLPSRFPRGSGRFRACLEDERARR